MIFLYCFNIYIRNKSISYWIYYLLHSFNVLKWCGFKACVQCFWINKIVKIRIKSLISNFKTFIPPFLHFKCLKTCFMYKWISHCFKEAVKVWSLEESSNLITHQKMQNSFFLEVKWKVLVDSDCISTVFHEDFHRKF